jgi:predicted  nucleic acid-binding Zn-ribbon protein
LEQRLSELDHRIEKVEDRQDKLEEKHEKHALEFAETRVYVREGYKKMESIQIALESMRTTSSSKWEQFFAKALWVILGVAGTYIATKIK